MKKRTVLSVASAVIVLTAGIGFLLKSSLSPPTIDDITAEKGYTISNQEYADFTISIQTSLLPDSIYTKEGHTFDRGEVVVYQNETTSICLERAVLSNESEDQLYLIFHYDYDLPESGSVLTPYQKTTTGAYTNTVDLRSRDITATDSVYPDSAALRGRGPAERFALYVSADTCRQAAGTMTIEAYCSKLTYRKDM